jgi:hypothetical protein
MLVAQLSCCQIAESLSVRASCLSFRRDLKFVGRKAVGFESPPGTKTILFKPLIINDLRQQSLLLTVDVANVRLFSGTNLGTVRISFVSKWVAQNVLFCLALGLACVTVNFVSITERAADNRSAENTCSRNSALALGTSI